MSKKVLFIANHRLGRSPGQRFRFEQYLSFLRENDYEWELSNIISEKDDIILYSNGNLLEKASLAKKAWKIRKNDAKRADNFDIVFIYREALLTRSVKFEKLFAASKAKVIFDFDDAIWLPNVSAGNKMLQVLKNPSKTKKIIKIADIVFTGNQYLADFASQFNPNVKIVPTTIDTNYHQRKNFSEKQSICIGWTGTQTTLKYLNELLPMFIQLKEKYQDLIYFKVICDTPWQPEGLEVINESWELTSEIRQLEEMDIGVMPLTDDPWSRGKCGFKGLQYMALEIPSVLSPVGVNREIIQHEVNGFLANQAEEWFRILSLLIENKNLRRKIGKEARKTIQSKYSVEANKSLYLESFNQLTKK